MKKTILIVSSIFLIVIFIAVGCKEQQKSTKSTLSDLQIEACNSADVAKTCDTRLPEVGIVLKEDCCNELGKCC